MIAKGQAKPPSPFLSGKEIRKSFLDFFVARGHTIVPSASLVPGDDPTLLFTNAGMVQFKDVFLDIGTRGYSRAVDVQKCMRVAGKHNDLDDVGRDDSHHTFFEMLGNWSFGDYYKKEAISWAWTLLTEVWGLPKDRFYAAVFEDEKGKIPRDDEAAEIWLQQPGFDPGHLEFFGRKENFWEMADTGPCGPDTEIHFDRGPEFCDKADVPGHVCRINGDCQRYLELWNLVFIQYNRRGPNLLEPLPKKHIDTGMGFERVVSLIQGVDSDYKTDLFNPLLDRVQELAGHSDAQRKELYTPYRVIADHARAATFLIADGVVPGNTGRNYVCRMIIRRASLFGSKAGFNEPFLGEIADVVINDYGDAYPELVRNHKVIIETITDEEKRFQHTVDTGVSRLTELLESVKAEGCAMLSGKQAFDLYATYGLPLEITRDIAREQGQNVDEDGFHEAMESHRLVSGASHVFEDQLAEDIDVYQIMLSRLKESGQLGPEGVRYDPYSILEAKGPILAMVRDGMEVDTTEEGDQVAVILPQVGFYVEAGGQISDTGSIKSLGEPGWEIAVEDTRSPLAGLIVLIGKVLAGSPKVGDQAIATVDQDRRRDIIRNHTATHLLHASLQAVLGEHARQAGSLVAPDRLRFDFTHAKAMTPQEIKRVEQMVNKDILAGYPVIITEKSRQEAIAEGAMALFGENYGEIVRTVRIGDKERISYELCGGVHVADTGVIGLFQIISESSVAAGIRRIEALTGHGSTELALRQKGLLRRIAAELGTSKDEVEERVDVIIKERDQLTHEIEKLHEHMAVTQFENLQPVEVKGIQLLTGLIIDANTETLRNLADRFRLKHSTGVVVLGTVEKGRPLIMASVSKDLLSRGLHAGELVRAIAPTIGGGGGGNPTMAQAGGKDPEKLSEALAVVESWTREHLS